MRSAQVKPKANQGSVTVRPLFGKARQRQVARELLKSDMHELRPGTAKQVGKRKR
jgi:hypothetical protein